MVTTSHAGSGFREYYFTSRDVPAPEGTNVAHAFVSCSSAEL